MKLVVNHVMGLNRAALAEGLAFARAMGLDPSRALEVLRAGAAYSRAMDTKGPKMIRGDFTPVARLSQHLKDVRLILRAARRADLRLPLEEWNRRLLERAMDRGGGDMDNSAVILAYEGL
jgi:3-hydroxyisobutyrate dehydrogenase-like beta-hydroxyacid dehydrogenase